MTRLIAEHTHIAVFYRFSIRLLHHIDEDNRHNHPINSCCLAENYTGVCGGVCEGVCEGVCGGVCGGVWRGREVGKRGL